jgi:UDP-glucose 4-epimerase
MTKRILITGIAGFIGSHVVESYIDVKGDLYGIDNFSTGKEENLEENIDRIEQLYNNDIGDRATTFAIFEKVKPDIVIHLAAQPSLLASMEKPSLDVATNVWGTVQIIEASKLFGVKHFIFSSTSAVCEAQGQSPEMALSPWDLPTSVYGISKMAAEMYIRALLPKKHTIFRFANIYGERQVPLGKNQIVPHAIKHILYGDDFTIRSDGTPTRDYTYVKDVARAISEAISGKIYGTYNLASGVETSVIDILNKLKDASEWDGEWQFGNEEYHERDRVQMLQTGFFEAFDGFEFTELDTGLTNTLEWWKKRDNG